MEFFGFYILFEHVSELFHEWNEIAPVLSWAALSLVFVFFELNFRHLIAVWFAPPAIGAGLVGLVVPESLELQVAAFILFSMVSFYLRAGFLKTYVGIKDEHPPSTDRILNQTAICIEPINGYRRPGQISVDSGSWTAIEPMGEEIGANERVHVIGRKGLSLLVEKATDNQVNPRINRLVGQSVTWLGAGRSEVSIADRNWPARPVVPSTKIKPGQKVIILGVGNEWLFVEAVHDTLDKHSEMVGHIGECVHSIENQHQPGAARVKGVIWQARTDSDMKISRGVAIEVMDIDGSVLIVKMSPTL